MFRKKLTADDKRTLQEAVGACPRCGLWGVIPNIERCEAKWNDSTKSFEVAFSVIGACRSCNEMWQREICLREIPLIIADESECSCGSVLRLKSHTIRQVGNLVEFEGVYVCEACQRLQNRLLRKIGKRLSSLWNKTRKIEVGLKGISYEKESKEHA